jgi:hypothetical protein
MGKLDGVLKRFGDRVRDLRKREGYSQGYPVYTPSQEANGPFRTRRDLEANAA